MYIYIKTIQDSYVLLVFLYQIKNAADTIYCILAIFTPTYGVNGIYSIPISHQMNSDIIQTAIKIGHYTTS